MDEKFLVFDELIKSYLPKGSEVTGVNLKEKFSSLFVQVSFTITDEYQKEYELLYKNRVLEIRLIQGEEDKGLPITSFTVTQ